MHKQPHQNSRVHVVRNVDIEISIDTGEEAWTEVGGQVLFLQCPQVNSLKRGPETLDDKPK